jgi:hypothetical protein
VSEEPGEARRVRLVRKRAPKRRRVVLKRVRQEEPEGPTTAGTSPVTPPPPAPTSPRAPAPTSPPAAATAQLDGDRPAADLGEELPLDDETQEGVRKLARSMAAQVLPALIKRAISASAEQLADEGLRRVGAEVPVPGELASAVAERAQTVRGELSRLMAREIRELVSGATVSQEIQRLLTSVTFEIKTEIRLRPNEEAVRPSVHSRVRVKRSSDDDR